MYDVLWHYPFPAGLRGLSLLSWNKEGLVNVIGLECSNKFLFGF